MADFVLSENTKRKIEQMKGERIKLVGRLNLEFKRDICSEILMIPATLLLSLILYPVERQKLANNGDAIDVKLLEPEGNTCAIKLVKKGSGMYAFGEEWRNVVSRNHFRVDVPVDLWSFVDGELTRWFAMEYVLPINRGETSQLVTIDLEVNAEEESTTEVSAKQD